MPTRGNCQCSEANSVDYVFLDLTPSFPNDGILWATGFSILKIQHFIVDAQRKRIISVIKLRTVCKATILIYSCTSQCCN